MINNHLISLPVGLYTLAIWIPIALVRDANVGLLANATVFLLATSIAQVCMMLVTSILERSAWLGIVASYAVSAFPAIALTEAFHLELEIVSIAFVAIPLCMGVLASIRMAGSRRVTPNSRPMAKVQALIISCALLAAAVTISTFSDTSRRGIIFHFPVLGALVLEGQEMILGEFSLASERSLSRVERGELPTDLQQPPRVPNPRLGADYVFVIADTLRADRISHYGGSLDLMPAVNGWSDESYVFSNVRANSSWTKPSVGSMFTGLLPEQHGAIDREDSLSRDVDTLAWRLQRAGYTTAAFVTNFGNVGRSTGFDRGFDYFSEIRSASGWAYALGEEVNVEVRSFLDSIESEVGRPPVFLFIHYLDPHEPYYIKPDVANVGPVRRISAKPYDLDVSYWDRCFDQLVAELDAHLPSYHLLLTSDHGESFGERGAVGHGTALNPEQLSIPLILKADSGGSGEIENRLEGRDLFNLSESLCLDPDFDIFTWSMHNENTRRYSSIEKTTPGMTWLRPGRKMVKMRRLETVNEVLIWTRAADVFEYYDLEQDSEERSDLIDRAPDALNRLGPLLDTPGKFHFRREPAEIPELNRDLLRALGYGGDR